MEDENTINVNILKKVLIEYNHRYEEEYHIHDDFFRGYKGLCIAAETLATETHKSSSEILTQEEVYIFRKYIKENKSSNCGAYNYAGNLTNDQNHFYWPPLDRQSRLAWLTKHIQLNK